MSLRLSFPKNLEIPPLSNESIRSALELSAQKCSQHTSADQKLPKRSRAGTNHSPSKSSRSLNRSRAERLVAAWCRLGALQRPDEMTLLIGGLRWHRVTSIRSRPKEQGASGDYSFVFVRTERADLKNLDSLGNTIRKRG